MLLCVIFFAALVQCESAAVEDDASEVLSSLIVDALLGDDDEELSETAQSCASTTINIRSGPYVNNFFYNIFLTNTFKKLHW